jgi:hypothetical protein
MRSGNVVEVIIINLVGRGYDCRTEEIPPAQTLPEEDSTPPVLLDPEEAETDGATAAPAPGGTTTPPPTGGTTTTPPTVTPADDLITPESLIPPNQLAKCGGLYTEAVTGHDYGNTPSPVQRVRAAVLNSESAVYTRLPTRRATLNYVKVPGTSTNPPPAQSMPWSDAEINSEIKRTIEWYADYCILLTFRRVNLRPNDATRVAAKYDAWLRSLPQDLSMGLGDARSLEGDAVLASAINAAKQVIPDRREITVLFMDRNVGDVGGRLTQASFVPTGKNFRGVALHGADHDDQYILSHELIHALGNGGAVTWHHNSGDARSMSRITRRGIHVAAGLSAARMLDFAEYVEILRAGLLR